MKISVTGVRQCLKSFDFSTLFREHLGWDNCQAMLEIPVDGRNISLCALAQKRGFVAFVCEGHIPERAIRLKIDNQITKSAREHFVIYADKAKGQQVWQWVRREPGKPLASRDHRFDIRQSGDPLIQRLDQIAVSLDEEEEITVVDVAGRARAAFDVDRITKRFYDRFKSEHTAFLNFVKGIKAEADLQWYTSLMLNRLMFIYFIQKKGFLDGDTNYLRNRLQRVRRVKGKDKFQSFYRYFLLRLFHEGLGKSPEERRFDSTMEELIGHVPYLNGGFFEVHELEQKYPEIDIPDQAFEKLFDFFDQYRWHLDERPLRADNEINPDVVGYIFEKYVNQKQMGAYYTKEDITEYISKNTVIPFIFDTAQKKCAIAFNSDSALWRLLRDNPDRYIYPAVRHGVIHEDGSVVPEAALPDFVQTGMKDPNARMHDNRYNLQQAPAGDAIRLVTETWREYIYRRNRCLEVREKLRKGEVHQINDLITLNMDIWQFARDAVVNAEGPELLRAFWHAIAGNNDSRGITVLDPTCGSGAFLFAALRILETLYSDCLERMERFIEDIEGKPHHPEQYSDFKKVLAQIAKHPNERYFILKSIIINNLFGVDIMEEAVEICKLRLFLKLVAQVETVEQIEPLPDMDFNSRAGNTLVGFASLEQVKKSMEGDWIRLQSLPRIEEDAEMVERAFRQFRAQQTIHGGKVTYDDKQELRKRLAKLDEELDRYLASQYGINVKSQENFDAWKASHQPFHWFVEFYGIMSSGGFDVIIGNPPYVSTSKVDYVLQTTDFKSLNGKNLYSLVMERSLQLNKPFGYFGMIVPVSIISGDGFIEAIKQFSKLLSWVSSFSNRPGKLFSGVEQRLTILLSKHQSGFVHSTEYQHWYEKERCVLFHRLTYSPPIPIQGHFMPLKTGYPISVSIADKIYRQQQSLHKLTGHSQRASWFHDGPTYWIRALPFQPIGNESIRSNHYHRLNGTDQRTAHAITSLMASSIFYFHYKITSNCRDLGSREINLFRFPTMPETTINQITTLASKLGQTLQKTAKRCSREYPSGTVKYNEYYPVFAKTIIDKIDKVLAQHYGLTDEELDFIINYDIKYRMGNADDENGDDE